MHAAGPPTCNSAVSCRSCTGLLDTNVRGRVELELPRMPTAPVPGWTNDACIGVSPSPDVHLVPYTPTDVVDFQTASTAATRSRCVRQSCADFLAPRGGNKPRRQTPAERHMHCTGGPRRSSKIDARMAMAGIHGARLQLTAPVGPRKARSQRTNCATDVKWRRRKN